MYFYMDSSGFIAGIYFPVLIVMGSFFFLNLFLAVITDTFSEMVKLQQQQEHDQLSRLNSTNRKAEGLSKDEQVSAFINITKKKAQISGGIGNLSDAAMMFLAKAKEEQKRVQEENDLMNQASILASQKEMKSCSSNQSDNALGEQGQEPIGNQAAAIENKINNIPAVKSEIIGEQSKGIKREQALDVV